MSHHWPNESTIDVDSIHREPFLDSGGSWQGLSLEPFKFVWMMLSMMSWFCWYIHSSFALIIWYLGKKILCLWFQRLYDLSSECHWVLKLYPYEHQRKLITPLYFNWEASLISWVGLSGSWRLIQGVVSARLLSQFQIHAENFLCYLHLERQFNLLFQKFLLYDSGVCCSMPLFFVILGDKSRDCYLWIWDSWVSSNWSIIDSLLRIKVRLFCQISVLLCIEIMTWPEINESYLL